MRFISILFFLLFTQHLFAQTLTSPDKNIIVTVGVSDSATAWYSVAFKGKEVLGKSRLGLTLDNADYAKGLKLLSASASQPITDRYQILSAKRKACIYTANKKIFRFTNTYGNLLEIIFQVSNDGVAFRYFFPSPRVGLKIVTEEKTAYHFPENTAAWLQPMSVAKSGWEQSNPAYEEYYQQGVAVSTPSPLGAGWVYPALFKTGDTWMLITEAAMDGTWCGTKLAPTSDKNELKVTFPDSREIIAPNGLLPQAEGPLYSPWQVIAIGSLPSIMHSTLGTDVAAPAVKGDFSFVKPGLSSWSWIMSKDNYIIYPEQIKYIDFAADMHWQYCLVDADWDKRIGYDSMALLSKYAAGKNVSLLAWYNSSGDWNTVKYSPKSKLLTHADRVTEFSRLQAIGIKGIKVDFFGGDGRSVIQYYIDILKDAATYKLMVNFHGATLPRGWARTYPNLVTTEAVRGFENVTFRQEEADQQATICTTVPFTRNAFDPMDYTPTNLYKVQGRPIRRTSSAFELALSVIFLSGIQHIAESPDGMSHVPPFVKTFMQNLPGQWDDVKFLDGYPGKYVVLARRSGNKWYIAGINSDAVSKTVNLNLSSLKMKGGKLITQGDDLLSFTESYMEITKGQANLTMKPNGGFVLVLE